MPDPIIVVMFHHGLMSNIFISLWSSIFIVENLLLLEEGNAAKSIRAQICALILGQTTSLFLPEHYCQQSLDLHNPRGRKLFILSLAGNADRTGRLPAVRRKTDLALRRLDAFTARHGGRAATGTGTCFKPGCQRIAKTRR